MKSGKQTITEICEDCKCHVRNLSISDIIVKKTDLILKDEDGNEITRTEPRAKCYCENCDHGS
jgi:hypothetical protein|tara:strand:- start:380 stop:568 length:189 start_codon:yes stop_codon:yes gene_type:complete